MNFLSLFVFVCLNTLLHAQQPRLIVLTDIGR